MEKIILPAFRANVPDIPEEIAKPGWNLPLYIIRDDREGIDLDFGPLLLFDKAILDSANYDFLQDSTKKYLRPIKESIRVLKEEGYLEIVDFQPFLEASKEKVITQSEKAIVDPREWTIPILKSLSGWEKWLPRLSETIGSDYDPTSLHSEFGAYVYLMKRDGKIIPSEEARIMKLMRSKRQRISVSEREELRTIVAPTVQYLYTNIALGEMLQAPFIDVDFSSELYGMVYEKSLRTLNPSTSGPINNINVATQLFNVAIPHLRPKTPLQMISLLKDKRIENFRKFISDIAEVGGSIDQRTTSELMSEALKAEREIQKVLPYVKWPARVISLLPLAAPFVVLGEESFEAMQHRDKRKKFNWLYALIDNVL